MNTFEHASQLSLELANAIREKCGLAEAFKDITVPEPRMPMDELYFCRLVVWSYVFINEAFPVAEKQLTSIMRASNPKNLSAHGSAKNIINALRTHQCHNLPSDSKDNERKLKEIKIWHTQNSGDPIDWQKACVALIEEVLGVLANLFSTWHHATEIDVDCIPFIEKLVLALQNDWPSHHFDAVISSSANKIGLSGLNAAAFRNSEKYVEDWRKVVSVFNDRESATEALGRVIEQELSRKFGRIESTAQ